MLSGAGWDRLLQQSCCLTRSRKGGRLQRWREKMSYPGSSCCSSAGLQGSRVCSLYACLPCLCLLSHWVFHEFFWLPLITVTGVKLCPLLSSWENACARSARLDLVTKNALEVTAFMSKIDRHETKMDYGNTWGIFLLIAVNDFKISFPIIHTENPDTCVWLTSRL